MPLALKTEDKMDVRRLTALCAEAVHELRRAARKHPLFPADFVGRRDCARVTEALAGAREQNDGDGGARATASSVFVEKWYEMVEAVLRGDAEGARRELTQAMAMLLRIHVHLDEYCA